MSSELDEIQAIFFEECAEGLAAAEEGLTAMAAGDAAPEVIARVFRAVHSIKGGSGAFGHAALLAFSHSFENVLDEIRAERIALTGEVAKVLLIAFDVLSDHVAAAQGQGDTPADAPILAQLEDILAGKGPTSQTAEQPAVQAPASAPDDLDIGFVPVAATIEALDEFDFSPVMAIVEDLDARGPAEPAPEAGALVEWIVRFGPSRAAMANGAEPLLVIRELETLGAQVIGVDCSALPDLRELDPEESYLSWTLSLPGEVEQAAILECFDFVATDSVISVERAQPETPPSPEPDLGQASGSGASTPPPPPAPSREPAEARATEPAAQTIRVDLGKLDMLLNLVGELVIRGSILADRLSPRDRERVQLPELSRLTREIQDIVMSLRAQPVRQAFSRVPRMLRDLSAETGKQVSLETYGETTEVDKGVIEKIGDPLTHLIRNAVDHGIEPEDQRLAAGKPAVGRITLSAEQKGARILIRVADDGRGIDRARVRAKAIERGIISHDANLSDEEIDQLICAPGFSTADTISNISGRGVGMDVVRSNVESLGGRLEIASVPGQGTTFTMTLPLTLAILDGMIVRIENQRFVLPLANVVEAVRPEKGQVRSVTPNTETMELRGRYLPVKRLSDLFGFHPKVQRKAEDSPVIIVASETCGNVGLMVDMIDDRREVVIKSLDENLYPIRGLSGATILGDGSIALILDVEALLSSQHHTFALKGLAA